MKNKIESFKNYYLKNKKQFLVGGGVVILVLFFLLRQNNSQKLNIIPVHVVDLKQTVLATGQVTSKTDLDLSLNAGGLISYLPVSVGDKVYKGQVLASIENRSAYASLVDARANFQKVLEGSSDEEIAVAQASLDTAKTNLVNTKNVQDSLVESSRLSWLNADLTPTASSGTNTAVPVVTGTYTGTEGSYVISPYVTSSGGYFSYSGIEVGVGVVSTNAPQALGTKGLYIQFPANFSVNTGATWTINLPNKQSVSYLTAYNNYQNAIKNRDSAIANAQANVSEKEASFNLKQSAARDADVAIAQAKVDQALAVYNQTVLYAPANGTIVHVDTKIGEHVDAQKPIIALQDISNLYVEANVNETNIAKIKLDLPVSMTLDAFGPGVTFTGKIAHIDPSSTTLDGVVNYVIKASIEPNPLYQVRPGMNANMMITSLDLPHVVAVPKTAIATKEGVSSVNLITNKKDKYKTQIVTTGEIGDGNMIEIKSGLVDGDTIAIIE